ncbi:MAG TPA: hypothetical protein VLF93_07000 [Candidatus Saccharimonadales bacterium]|nr:hypothetical protein [Candidatus Saccharimonadales bacterium]
MNAETKDTKEVKRFKFITNYLEYVYEGLLAFIILLIPPVVAAEKLDLWLKFALGCFTIAIPFLTLCLIMIFYRKHDPDEIHQDWYEKWHTYHPYALTIGLGAGLLGIDLTFFHVATILGGLFILSTLSCLLIHHICVDRKEIDKK